MVFARALLPDFIRHYAASMTVRTGPCHANELQSPGSAETRASSLQDKYLELSPEPVPVDEWWIDARTQGALERAVGLGDHVTFTADQTRPLQLTRSQVRASLHSSRRCRASGLMSPSSWIHIAHGDCLPSYAFEVPVWLGCQVMACCAGITCGRDGPALPIDWSLGSQRIISAAGHTRPLFGALLYEHKRGCQCYAQVAEMTFDTYRTMWRALVEAGSACLLASGGVWDPASAACQRLRQISDESGELRIALALSHPTRLTSYHYAMGQVSPSTPGLLQTSPGIGNTTGHRCFATKAGSCRVTTLALADTATGCSCVPSCDFGRRIVHWDAEVLTCASPFPGRCAE
jgi:hypothetical protein